VRFYNENKVLINLKIKNIRARATRAHMPSPHDCLAGGHSTSPGAFPLNTTGMGMMDISRKPIWEVYGAVPTPTQPRARHERPLALPKSASKPSCLPPAGEANSDSQNPDVGRSNGSNPRPTTRLRYSRPSTSSAVRWATCRWLLSGHSVDRAQPYFKSAARGADRTRRPDRRFTGNFEHTFF
jgi:hypothetical protein